MTDANVKSVRIDGRRYKVPTLVYFERSQHSLVGVAGRGKNKKLLLKNSDEVSFEVSAVGAQISRYNNKNKFLVASAIILYDVLVSRGCDSIKSGVLVNELVHEACMYEIGVGTALLSVAMNFSTLIPSKKQ